MKRLLATILLAVSLSAVGVCYGQAQALTGFMALQPAGRNGGKDTRPPQGGQLISAAEMQTKNCAGDTHRLRPEWISVPGKQFPYRWDFSIEDGYVQTNRAANKPYKILIVGGGQDPLAEATLAFYEAAYQQLGQRYGNDPLFVAVHACCPPTGHSEEPFWGKRMPAAAKAGIKRMIVAANNACPRQFIVVAGTANDQNAMKEIITFGVQTCGSRFVYKNNALSAKPNTASNNLVVWAGQHGAGIWWEMLDNSSASRFGGSFQQAYNQAKSLAAKAGRPFGFDFYQGDFSNLARLKL